MKSKKTIYDQNDYKLLYLIFLGDKEAETALIEKYKMLIWRHVNNIFSKYVPSGVERDDLFQEGAIAVYKSFDSFDVDRNVPFFAFANLCIERAMISYIRKYSSETSKQFYNSLPLDAFVSDEISLYNSDVLADPNIESAFKRYDEQFGELFLNDCTLSSFEKNVLVLQVVGFTYSETGITLKCSTKKVDNTMQKIKRLLN